MLFFVGVATRLPKDLTNSSSRRAKNLKILAANFANLRGFFLNFAKIRAIRGKKRFRNKFQFQGSNLG